MLVELALKHLSCKIPLQTYHLLIVFDMEFQQVTSVCVMLQDLVCKMEGREDRQLYAVFKAITNQETALS